MAKPASERAMEREGKREWEEDRRREKERSEHPVEVLPPPLRGLPLMKEGEEGEGWTHSCGHRTDQREHKRLQMWRPMKHLRSFFFMQLFTAVGQPPLFPCHFDLPLHYCLLGDIFTAHCYRLLLEKNPPLCSWRNSETGTALSPPSITLLNLKPYGTPSLAQTEGRDGGMEAADRRISAGGVDAGVCWAQTGLCLFWGLWLKP